ncbi:MAG: lipoprotein insertase outer membrane protein LolB [Gammaproteobacteria bacterium]|nr:lipoprotein insertase outer membrane protein LolB [Gammaproteobacteria bacterium]
MAVKYWLTLGLTCVLGACSSLPVPTPLPGTAEALWQQRQPQLTDLRHWAVNGRLAIFTRQTGWHARIRWIQRDDGYLIQLDGPLGQGAAELHGSAAAVVLRTTEGEFSAASAEALLAQHLGWQLPVSGLHYWVRGLPDPGAAAERLTLDDAGRITRLQQSGWDIEFKHYTAAPLALPDRIFLTTSGITPDTRLDIRLVVEQWDAPH